MGALTIAFDTTIVGALALPWVVLVVHLFFFQGDKGLFDWMGRQDWKKYQALAVPAGVLLFALTYSLGSAVSRIAQDFFNDDDLHLQFPAEPPVVIRVGVTESRILASVYCQNEMLLRVPGDSAGRPAKVDPDKSDPLIQEISHFKDDTTPADFRCVHALSWLVRRNKGEVAAQDEENDFVYNAAADIFGLQENALMEKGADYTVRLRQLHDQVMVLRGAAFNGVLTFSLCLFAWGAQVRCQKPRSSLLWAVAVLALAAAPGIYLALTVVALLHHILDRGLSDPPFMEYTLLLLGLAGAWLVWRRPSEELPEPAGRRGASPEDSGPGDQGEGHSGQANSAEVKAADAGKPARHCWQREPWGRYTVLSLVLTGAAIFGWWSTEVFYVEQVIYSFNSQGSTPPQK